MDPEQRAPDHADDRPDEVAQLRRERDALSARLASLEDRSVTRRRWRRTVVALLVAIGVICSTLSAVGWWARRNVADTDVWMQRVGPLADEPAVQAALGSWLSDEVIQLIDPRELFTEVLPERGRVLAVPLSGAVESFVRDRIDGFLDSDRFEQLWLAANERAHRAAVRVLRGESDVVQAQGDHVVINLVPVVDAALADIGSASPQLLGREVDLPDLTVEDLPDAAIQRLERALGIELDDDFGQFVVYDSGRLEALQDGLERARRWLIALSVTAVASLGVAVWLSDRRRRTALQVLAGLAIGIAVVRRLGIRAQRDLLAAIPDRLNRAAAEAVGDSFLGPLLDVTRILLIGLAAVAAVLLISGPYPWARWLRRRVVELARGLGSEAGGRDWIRRHRTETQVLGIIVAILLVLVVDLSFVALAVLAVLVISGWVLLDHLPVSGSSSWGDDPDGRDVHDRRAPASGGPSWD